jgi:DHA3 family macrolide efflux protein-like MFS transporter
MLIGVAFVLRVPIGMHRVSEELNAPKVSYRQQIATGFRALFAVPAFRRCFVLIIIVQLLMSPPLNTLPVFLTRFFNAGPAGLGAAEMAFAGCQIVGALIISAWGGTKNRMVLVFLLAAVIAVCGIGVGMAPNIVVACAFVGLAGLCMAALNIPLVTSIQERIPEQLLGRAMSLILMVNVLVGPLGIAMFGPLSDAFDMRQLFLVFFGIGLLAVLATAALPGEGRRLYALNASR